MPKLTTLLGWGAAKGAGEKIAGRKKQIETALSEAMGKPKPTKPKGSFKPKGKVKYKK